jgi:hypothetical protein
MPGAWERTQPTVMLAILTREIVATKWAMGFRNLVLGDRGGEGSNITFEQGAPYDVMRNRACEKALLLGHQWIMFLDDDVVPPADAFARLVAHGADVISGLYYRRNPPICPVAMIFQDGTPTWVTSWNPPGATVEVDLVGAGCLLIHRRVLERTPRPWFEWETDKPEHAGKIGTMSEDFAFCVHAKKAGFRIYLDTSVHCEHIGLGASNAADGSYRPSAL